MKALSIHQPWAWAILHAGKNVENRGWFTKYRGPLLIHASKTRASYDREALLDWEKMYGVKLPKWEELPSGALGGVVEVVDCLPVAEVEPGPWVKGADVLGVGESEGACRAGEVSGSAGIVQGS